LVIAEWKVLNPDFAVEIVVRDSKAIQERVLEYFWSEEIL
jgi:hypothetical protein